MMKLTESDLDARQAERDGAFQNWLQAISKHLAGGGGAHADPMTESLCEQAAPLYVVSRMDGAVESIEVSTDFGAFADRAAAAPAPRAPWWRRLLDALSGGWA